MKKTYSYSFDGENYNEHFKSRLEAIAEMSASNPEQDIIYTALNVVPERKINPYKVVDDVIDSTTEEAGEWADGYLLNVSQAQYDDLGEMLQKAWDEWEAKHGLEPKWFNAEDVIRHDLTQEDTI